MKIRNGGYEKAISKFTSGWDIFDGGTGRGFKRLYCFDEKGYVMLYRGDLEDFVTGSELLSLGIGVGEGDHWEIATLDNVLKQFWKPAKGWNVRNV